MRASERSHVSHQTEQWCSVDNQAALLLCHRTQDPSLKWLGAPCGSRGPGVKGTAAVGTGLEPYKEKLREKFCQCKLHPPGYLHASGRSGASVREDTSSQLPLWEDTYTHRAPSGLRISGFRHPWAGGARELFTPCPTGGQSPPCPGILDCGP